MVATIDSEDSPLTRIAAPTMLRPLRCAEELALVRILPWSEWPST